MLINKVFSFAPIATSTASTLVLGSIPGTKSLTATQYYAHPRNAFWPIMANIYQFNPAMPYEDRIKALKAADIAVWDVLQQCIRPGSLDSAIKKGSRIPNNFTAFFKEHPHIRLIAFNGAEAETSFKKHVLPNLELANTNLVRLPSSSPAHTLPLEKKMSAWRALLAT